MAVKYAPGEFCWSDLSTTDPDRIKKFYSAIFGWKAKDSPMGPGPDDVYSLMRLGRADAAAIYATPREYRKQKSKPAWLNYIWVRSVAATVKKATAAGGKVLMPRMKVMEHGFTAILADPSGAQFAIWEARAHKGAQAADKPGTVTWHDLNAPERMLSAASKFYEKVFGWKTTAQDIEGNEYFTFDLGRESVCGMWPSPLPKSQPCWITHFKVADCRKSAASIARLGGKIVMGPYGIEGTRRFAIATDPKGALFGIIGK